jgi:hypothetical protein
MTCDCKDWKKGMNSLSAAEALAYVHGWRYNGKAFRFCPWYKKKLRKEKKHEEK